jgi:hypothetical protein
VARAPASGVRRVSGEGGTQHGFNTPRRAITTGLSGSEAGAPDAAQASRDAEPETGRNLDTSRDGVPSSHAAHLTPESFHRMAPMVSLSGPVVNTTIILLFRGRA